MIAEADLDILEQMQAIGIPLKISDVQALISEVRRLQSQVAGLTATLESVSTRRQCEQCGATFWRKAAMRFCTPRCADYAASAKRHKEESPPSS